MSRIVPSFSHNRLFTTVHIRYYGQIFSMEPGTKDRRGQTVFLVDVLYADEETYTSLQLSPSTYGPAQCKIDTVRCDGRDHTDSYTAGWVFLVPVKDDPTAAAVVVVGDREDDDVGVAAEGAESHDVDPPDSINDAERAADGLSAI